MNPFRRHPLLWGLGSVLLSLSANAQVKVGDNPTTLAPNAVFQVEKGGSSMVVSNTGWVGIGTLTPIDKLDVVGGSIWSRNNGWAGLSTLVTDVSRYPTLFQLRGRGTIAAPTYPQNGDILGAMIARDAVDGLGPGNFGGGSIAIRATQTMTNSAKGARISFTTTLNGTTTETERMTVDHNGNVGFGTATPGNRLQILAQNSNGLAEDDMSLSSFGPNPQPTFFISAARGSETSPASLSTGQPIGNIVFMGHNGSGYSSAGLYAQYRGAGGTALTLSNNAGNSLGLNEIGDLYLNQGQAHKPGGGPWAATSDRRTKRDIRTYGDGLALVKQIRPVIFKYNGKGHTQNDGQDYYGVIAQEVQAVAPYMVKEIADKELGHKLTYDGTALTYALVNAVKELSAKLEKLEGEKAAITANYHELKAEVASIKAMLAQTAPATQGQAGK